MYIVSGYGKLSLVETVKKTRSKNKMGGTSSQPKEKTVMISYQWNIQPLAFRVRDYFEKNGVNVIIDAGDIKGDFLQWMAESVKAADAIILLLSPKYEQSVYCQKEAKFADSLGKKIIPLVGELGYTSGDGWLAMLIGGQIRYDIVNDFETTMANILRRELNVIPSTTPKELSSFDPEKI